MFQICGNLKQGCVTLWSRDVTRSQATLVYIIDLLCEALHIEDTLFFFTSRELACHQLTLRVIFLTMKESRNLSTCVYCVYQIPWYIQRNAIALPCFTVRAVLFGAYPSPLCTYVSVRGGNILHSLFCEAVKQENKCILNSQIILNDEVKLNIIYVTLSRRVLWVVSVQPV